MQLGAAVGAMIRNCSARMPKAKGDRGRQDRDTLRAVAEPPVVGRFIADGRDSGMARRRPDGEAGPQLGVCVVGLVGQVPSGIDADQRPDRGHRYAGAWPHRVAVAGEHITQRVDRRPRGPHVAAEVPDGGERRCRSAGRCRAQPAVRSLGTVGPVRTSSRTLCSTSRGSRCSSAAWNARPVASNRSSRKRSFHDRPQARTPKRTQSGPRQPTDPKWCQRPRTTPGRRPSCRCRRA